MARSLGDVLHLFLDDEAPASAASAVAMAPPDVAAIPEREDPIGEHPIVWLPVALDDAAAADAVESWCSELAGPTRSALVASPLGGTPDAWRHRARPTAQRAILARDARAYRQAIARLARAVRPDCLLARIPTGWVDLVAPESDAPRILVSATPTRDADAWAATTARWASAAEDPSFGLDVTGHPEAAGPWCTALGRRGVLASVLRSPDERRDWLLGAR